MGIPENDHLDAELGARVFFARTSPNSMERWEDLDRAERERFASIFREAVRVAGRASAAGSCASCRGPSDPSNSRAAVPLPSTRTTSAA